MHEVIRRYVKQMEEGLDGGSSLHMIPTWLGAGELSGSDEPVLVIDAGGTNLRIARVHLSGGELTIQEQRRMRMPGTQGPIDASELLELLAEQITELRGGADRCGFCFSYPAEILENGDGKVLHFDKDVHIRGAEGLVLGASINEVLTRRGERPMHFTVLNDTVATYFAGVLKTPQRDPRDIIGMIWGTGFNTCYLERASQIKKIRAPFDMVINMESGSYDGFPMTEADRALDAATAIPGDQLMEKKTSGAYLGQNLYYALLECCARGELDETFAGKLRERASITTEEMSLFCTGTGALVTLCERDDQRSIVRREAERVADRACEMAALTLAAIMECCDIGRTPDAPAVIVAEGTTYQKFAMLHDGLLRHADRIIKEMLGRHYQLIDMSQSNLAGSALAAAIQK